ncbi:zinc-dependent alcohol dehydrogenase [Bradyrhizobium cenepequi]|uniref:zinc-dependent alcohol dehydrogenase n=1 Tax=Bradyrhizobium cenepequi TaxID=2821403 RepID=UPI001CE39939|nr:zinc-binding alcohol dehydrogenase [Bradyrhizobium cenepequi]MCA6112872.1 zinc-binding alcohol dehydrogenase [Bradyrhizobium cenepequi]
MAVGACAEIASALWYCRPGEVEIRQEAMAAPGAGEVRVKTLYSAISRGTESLVFGGRVPVGEFERMRAPFMAGDFPFPAKYGYAAVGRVESDDYVLRGKNVFALYPHQTAFNIPVGAVLALPEEVPPHRAVLAANMETALNGVWDAAPGPADRIVIIGAGVVGSLVAYLCGRIPGTDVTLIDINPTRAELAGKLGVSFTGPGDAIGDCDLVVHASGSPDGLRTALELAGDEATVLEMSWYGDAAVTATLGGPFHSRRLRLVSSQVGQIAPSHRPRWTHGRRLAAAIALLCDPRLDALLAPAVAFHDLPQRLPGILDPGSGILCQPIIYS